MVRRSCRATNRRRSGTVMVLFALMMVAILALVGVAVEMGVVRVTRDRMQSAADATAREILRERDYAKSAAAQTDAALRDLERRERNRVLASWTFDGEGLSEDYASEEQGAGPYHRLSNGEGNVNWGRVYEGQGEEKIGHSIPVLELNQDGSGEGANQPQGDIVTGRFTGTELGFDGNPVHLEDSVDYQRADFDPEVSEQAPFGDSVLVRIRQTFSPGMPGNNPLDRQAGISSSGWTLPLVFLGGSTVIGTDPTEGYSLRHHGIPLRATAIAQSKPAVRVGVARPEYGEEWGLGVGTVVMNSEYASTSRPWWTPGPDGKYIVVAQREDYSLLDDPEDDARIIAVLDTPRPMRVGDEVHFVDLDDDGAWYQDTGYKTVDWGGEEIYSPLFFERPISTRDSGLIRFVCGFMHIKVELDRDESGEVNLQEETGLPFLKITVLDNVMTPGKPWIAPRNASALFDGLQDTTIGAAYWAGVLQRLEGFDELGLLVHAPALVR